ncbi:MAG: type II CRISPR RNA-guided endonuclease Cas9 [Planctomycetota bacterium]|nr:type II CRISPR RNA-guided endonuclease Cas9 [Planctomycetota bacterium]
MLENSGKPSISAIGVRVFPEGVNRDKGLEKPKNATRREARGARRIRYRRNLRRDQILRTLQSNGLLPKDKNELHKLFEKEPYRLRRKGLDEKLELYEFGRAIFHINQHRGFKSNRKSGKANENSVVIKGCNELQKAIDEKGCRTLGEYFASINPEEQRIRERYTFRSMYEKEFDLLWGKQSQYYPELLGEELRKKIRDEIIFFQRPLKPSDELIGNCELEPEEKRCPRGNWYARRFRLLQDVNNLIIQNTDGTEQKLTDEQRKQLLEELSQKKELTYSKIRAKFDLLETQVFNLEQDGKIEKLKGDIFSSAMRGKNIFGTKVWDSMDEQKKIELNEACVELEDDELAAKLRSGYGLDEKQIDAVLKISLPQGYMSFSRKAILKLLPFMETGLRPDQAKIKAGYDDSKQDAANTVDMLPLPSDLRNPIVQKALFEVRKVVNALVREYGKPAKIKLEMARDVKGNKRQREELQKKMWENEARNKDAKDRLKEKGVNKPTRDDIIKYKLWEECNFKCPYTGKDISQTALFGEHPEFQIEHILPYDRSLDDSYMNKTLCYVHENIHVKGSKMPYEAYSHDVKKFEEILQRVNKSKMPYPKKQKFWQKELNLDEHIQRELNDTRYICKEVVKYLRQLGVYTRGSKGKITAELRHQWGLDGIFDELGSRRDDDHRRHAVDAVIIGVTENEHLRRLAKSKYAVKGELFEQPWLNFREEVAEKVKHVDVSHRVTRKVSGPLHEETSYGPTGKKDENGQEIFVYRKKLEDLTVPMAAKIVDPVVREIVKNRLIDKGMNPDKNQKIPKELWQEPLYMRSKKGKKVLIKKVRIRDVFNNMIVFKDKDGKPYRAVSSGNNHHIEIFEYTDKKGNVKRDGKVITMFDAVQRSQTGEPVVHRDYGDGKKFACSLGINEMFMIEMDDGSSVLHRVQKLSQGGLVVLRPHTYSGKLSDSDKPPLIQRKSPNTLKGRKVTVDPLGRIWPAND